MALVVCQLARPPEGPSLRPIQDLTGQVTCRGGPVASGGFGDIHKGTWKNDLGVESPVAVKVTREKPKRVERQVKLGAMINDDHVLTLLGFCDELRPMRCLVYPFHEHGNVVEYLKKKKDANRLIITSDVAKGLEHLHMQDIVHGDLKGLNVLIRSDGGAVICDFDRSRVIGQSGYTTSFAGSWRHQAPEYSMSNEEDGEREQIEPVRVTKEGDIYAFAMTSLEILSGEVPFNHLCIDYVIWAACCKRRPLRNRYNIPIPKDTLWALMEACWDQAPERRPTVKDVVKILNAIQQKYNARQL